MNKPSVTFYALHMKAGGAESTIATWANMLINDFNVKIVSFYNYGDIPYDLDDRIQIQFLSSFQSNKDELKISLKNKQLFCFFKQILLALKILYLRRILVVNHIKHNQDEVLISTRLLFHSLIGKYGKINQLKLCQEHVDHKNNQSYIKKVLNSTKKCDFLMPVSKFLCKSYKGVSSIKIKYIKHATDVPKEIKYDVNSKQLICVGRLSPEKGHVDLINVFSELKKLGSDYKLKIIGDGIEREKLCRQIEVLDLKKDIELTGFLNKNLIYEEFEKSKLNILTSFEESFGLVLIEGFSRGVPAIAFDSARGAKELINSYNGKLISNRNVKTMAAVIRRLSNEDFKDMSKSAYKTAQEYDYNKVKKELINFINSEIKYAN